MATTSAPPAGVTSAGRPVKSQPAPQPRSLIGRVLFAASWSMAGYFVGQILRIASSLILTRLLVPEMFGIMAVATMLQVIVAMLSDFGLRQALIQSPRGDDQAYLDTSWSLQILHGWLIWAACAAVALGISTASGLGWFPAGSVYAEPILPAIITVTAFTMVIGGLQSTKIASCQRHLDFRRITVIELVAQVVSLVVAVLLGWLTRSIWSFVVSALLAAMITTVLSHIILPGPRNRFRIEKQALQELVHFGRWILISSTFSVIAANGDRILLAGWISPAQLGTYVLAFNLVAMLDGIGGRLFTTVATPSLSVVARENRDRMRSAYFKFRAPFDIVFVGGAGFIYSAGPAIIDLLYDHRYASAGPTIQILSFSLLVSRFAIMTSVYLALGEPHKLSLLQSVKALSIFTIVPAAYWLFGFEGALWAIALHGLPTLPIMFYLNAKNRLNSIAFEVGILLVWPVGYFAGSLFT